MHAAYNLHFLAIVVPVFLTLLPAAAVPTPIASRSWLPARISRWIDGFSKPQPAMRCDKPRSNRHLDEDIQSFVPKDEERPANEIPSYVLDYAPLVHLYSGEKFWPCDIAEHLEHVTPYLNYTQIRATSEHLNLTNLDELNQYNNGRFVYLTSDDNVEARPDWLGGEKNIPDTPDDDATGGGVPEGRRNSARQQHPLSSPKEEGHPILGGRSSAPAVLITVDKPDNITDAFWFFFYSYNLGNLVFNIRFGNHIGDWEHTLVRFRNGQPTHVFVSEHYFGQAYTYDAVEKAGEGEEARRPVVYSAVGTHAMYATPGHHPYVLPLGLLHDETDKGPLWDPVLNALTYTYNPRTDILTPSTQTPTNQPPHTQPPQPPTQWFNFRGHWGDRHYPLRDSRQYEFAGQYHYVDGPLGPRFKNLKRRKVCQGRERDPCVVHDWLPPVGAIVGGVEGGGLIGGGDGEEGEGVGEVEGEGVGEVEGEGEGKRADWMGG